jgi:hypothetical protein
MPGLLEALLIGVLSGVVSGALVTWWSRYRWQPRVSHGLWVKTPFAPDKHIADSDQRLGTLYKSLPFQWPSSPEFSDPGVSGA